MKKRNCWICKQLFFLNKKHFYTRGVKNGVQLYGHSCKPCTLKYLKQREVNNPKVGIYRKQYNRNVRLEVLKHYSNGIPKCSCCGESIVEFLGIDHINGGGGKHRKQLIKDGLTIYLWLRKNDYPEGFRVLCHNCNLAIGFYGKCPHTIKT